MPERPNTAVLRALGGGAVAAGGLVVAGAVGGARLAKTVLHPRARRPRETQVLGVDVQGGMVQFAPTRDATMPGLYSFWFDGGRGHARVGAVVEQSTHGVTRELLGVDAGDMRAAHAGRFNGWVYLSPAAIGVPSESVKIATTVGAAPAWIVPAEVDTGKWAVIVHGRSTVRQEVLRAVPAFRAAGYSSILISYRNDGEAPESSDDGFPLGDTEWLDVESAVLAALDRGATEVVLMGWSIGGAIALQTLARSRIASVISGVVLESPVISWSEMVLRSGERLPRGVKKGVLSLAATRWGPLLTGEDEPFDRAKLDFVARADDITVPVLILHSEDDGYAPIAASRRLAEERPDMVRLVPFRIARHTRLWNLDRARWESAVTSWLRGDAETLAAAGTAVPRSAAGGAHSAVQK